MLQCAAAMTGYPFWHAPFPSKIFKYKQAITIVPSSVFAAKNPKVLCLFDVDGTLTPARLVISPEMKKLLQELREKVVIGFVGGSDLVKQQEQIAENCVELFDYCFSENGLTAFKLGNKLESQVFNLSETISSLSLDI